MANWDAVVTVTCPDCGVQRQRQRPDRGIIKRCRSCVTKAAKIANDWGETHGESKTPLYHVWSAMKARCTMDAGENHARYKGRGITFCPEWSEFVPFREWALANGYKNGLLLDRRDNDGNYEPSNCRWVESHVSALNRSTTKRNIADVAVIKELAALGLRGKLIGALYGISGRRISDIKHEKVFSWVTPVMIFEEAE